MEKRKLESDAKLILVLLGILPIDWCRKDNGDLVFLNPAGQKFTYTADQLNDLTDKKLAEKDRSIPRARNAEIPAVRRPQGAITEGKSKSKQKSNIDLYKTEMDYLSGDENQ